MESRSTSCYVCGGGDPDVLYCTECNLDLCEVCYRCQPVHRQARPAPGAMLHQRVDLRNVLARNEHYHIDSSSHCSSAIDQASVSSSFQPFSTAQSSCRETDQQRLLDQASLEGTSEYYIQSSTPQDSPVSATVTENPTNSRGWTAGSKTDRYGSKLRAFNIKDMAALGIFPKSLSHIRETLMDFAGGNDLWAQEPSPMGPWQVKDKIGRFRNKRIAKEMRTFRKARQPPWVACAPIQSKLDHLLAGIEGPPGTPYEGGLFWIEIRIPRDYPFKPPCLRFLTRTYHPGIDSLGRTCLSPLSVMDWTPAYTIEKILIALCSFLDDPCPMSALVPEIAETYRKEYDMYLHNARTYTIRYAFAEPPTECRQSGLGAYDSLRNVNISNSIRTILRKICSWEQIALLAMRAFVSKGEERSEEFGEDKEVFTRATSKSASARRYS